MKKINNQHGDLILQEVEVVPEGAKKIEIKKGYVLERGEGVHTHVLEDTKGVTVYEKDGDIFVVVTEEVRIKHEEHGYQTLKPGIHKKFIERVWDYETEEARKVID